MADWTDEEIKLLRINTHLKTFDLGLLLLRRGKDSINSARKRYNAPYSSGHLSRVAVQEILNDDGLPEIIREFFLTGGWSRNYGDTLHFEAGHNWIITGDWQLPAGDYAYIALMCAYAKKYLPEGDRNLAITGDFINGDSFSRWKNIIKPASWETELDTLRHTLYLVFEVFDRVVFMPGNHEYRWLKALKGESTFSEMMAGALYGVTNVPEVIFTPVDRIVIGNANPNNNYDWLICHGENFSVNPLKVADEYTWAHDKNIIIHHEHHWAGGIHRYGRQEIIDNGTLCDPNSLVYKSITTGKYTAFELGFVHLLPTGYAKRFGSSLVTDWDALLPIEEKED